MVGKYPIVQNLKIVNNDNLPKTLTITDSNGDPVDISDWDFSMIVKTDDKAPDSSAYVHLEDSDFTKSLGQASFNLEAVGSGGSKIPDGTYIYAIRVSKTGSRKTYMTGKLLVEESPYDGATQ
jgi:hypothetical protein